MAKKNLVVFGFDTLFTPDSSAIASWADPILDSEKVLKVFIASDSEPCFEWPKVFMLGSRTLFLGHCISTTQSRDDCFRLLANLIRLICMEHDVHRKFFFAGSQADFAAGNNFGLTSVLVNGQAILPEQFLLV